jgi:hypothetical protein
MQWRSVSPPPSPRRACMPTMAFANGTPACSSRACTTCVSSPPKKSNAFTPARIQDDCLHLGLMDGLLGSMVGTGPN